MDKQHDGPVTFVLLWMGGSHETERKRQCVCVCVCVRLKAALNGISVEFDLFAPLALFAAARAAEFRRQWRVEPGKHDPPC